MENLNNPYIPKSGVKPRFDGKGSEFGLIHRELPRRCGMFDIDRMSATATFNLELKKQNIAFIEYRTNFSDSSIEFKALFEVKKNKPDNLLELLNCKTGIPTWAQLQLCKLINARYFLVIATNGKQPFIFYEIFDHGNYTKIGILDYKDKQIDGVNLINNFWKHKLNLI